MATLFGTDGVRGVANDDLTPDLTVRLGQAAGLVLAPGGGVVVVGRDTRLSGTMLEAALVAGLCSAGATVRVAGVLPTPAVAWLTLAEGARAGAAISASHNPVPDNGIKLFSPAGYKLGVSEERAIERAMEEQRPLLTGTEVGVASPLRQAEDRYAAHLLSSVDSSLEGLAVVLDCAHGAACGVAPDAFEQAGAEVTVIHGEPDGRRINVACGSTSLEDLSSAVVERGADLGLAFDGDADRVLAVDERGAEIDGDRIIALCALRLLELGRLPGSLVVATVMSNLGFVRALEKRGVKLVITPVGDRHVAEAMLEHGAALGGEQSGHVIFSEHSTTGDGILTGLQVAAAAAGAGPVSRLTDLYEPFPQVLVNVPVRSRGALEEAEEVWAAVRSAEEHLGTDGRVLIRASGTEPLVRVMVEAAEPDAARSVADELAGVVGDTLGR
jgi:phosphoglucosamine mutase